MTGVWILWLSGCSSLGLGYGNGPALTTWWVDRHLDLSSDQSVRVRAALDQVWVGHRSQRLSQDLELMARFEREVQGEVTPAQVCAWVPLAQGWAEGMLVQLAPAIAAIGPTLQASQLQRLEERMARSNEDWAREHLQEDPAERLQAQLDRIVSIFETLYGRLERRQKEGLRLALSRSVWDPERALAERKAHQQDTLNVLRQLGQGRAAMTLEAAQALVRAWLVRQVQPVDEVERRHRSAFLAERCQQVADLHRTTTPEQRRHAGQTLAGWQDDLRGFVISAGRSPRPGDSGAPARP